MKKVFFILLTLALLTGCGEDDISCEALGDCDKNVESQLDKADKDVAAAEEELNKLEVDGINDGNKEEVVGKVEDIATGVQKAVDSLKDVVEEEKLKNIKNKLITILNSLTDADTKKVREIVNVLKTAVKGLKTAVEALKGLVDEGKGKKTCKVTSNTDTHRGVVTCDKTTKTKCDTDKGTWDPPSCEPSAGTERQTPVEEKVCKVTKDTDTHTGVVTCDKTTKTKCDTDKGTWDPPSCEPSAGKAIKVCKVTKDTDTHANVITCDTMVQSECSKRDGEWGVQCTKSNGMPKIRLCKVKKDTDDYIGVITCDTTTKANCQGEWDSQDCRPSDGTPIKICKVKKDTTTHIGIVTCKKTTKTKCNTDKGTWGPPSCNQNPGALIPAGVVFVKAGTRTTKNGKTWKTAYSDLQKAIDEAKKANKPKVYVAQGTYKPTGHPNGGNGGREKHFSLRNGVEVIGGYKGEKVDESNNPNYYKTILSGDNNAYHVFYHPAIANLDKTAKLVEVTITKGNANGSDPHEYGGGMYNYNSHPTLTTVIFESNKAGWGGGMYNEYSSPELRNVTFESNKAGWGGGMYNKDNSKPKLTNVTFTSNEASYGGGMFNINSSPELKDVTFDSNEAKQYGGGMYNKDNSKPKLTNVTFTSNEASYGGGMFNINSSPELKDVTFDSNEAKQYGGGMGNEKSSPTLKDVEFTSNTADLGGGMYNNNSSPKLTNVTFTSNTANRYGGGMFNSDSYPTLRNVTFTSNEASYGGGMTNYKTFPTLKDVTFTSNTATKGGGMYNYKTFPTLKDVTFNSNEAKQYGGGMYNSDNSKPTLDNTVIFNKNIAGSIEDKKEGKGGAIYNVVGKDNIPDSSITGTPTYGTGTNENKKVVKVGNTYKLVQSNLESGQ